jgi:hypothetical protein
LDLAPASSKAVCQGAGGVFQLREPGDHPAHHSPPSCAKAFPFNKMVPGLLDPEMVEDTARIVNEAMKDKVQVNLIINNRAGGNVPLIAEKIADRLHSEKQQKLF